VSDLLLQRGIEVSYQTVKDWNDKFADVLVEEIRQQRRKPTRRWHVDEMHIKICGKKCYLWRAVDDKGILLDVFVTERRNKQAAQSFFERLLGGYERPTKVTTDRLRSYKSVIREQSPKTKHIRGKWLNNRAENSHLPVRQREKRMKRFKSPKQAQFFLSRYEFIYSFTKPMRHLLGANSYRRTVLRRLRLWAEICLVPRLV
jgi:putative transposase